ncbi:MAG: Uma2 family endonuclease [Dehalococcoidia bacterium]|nr:Uma2 family endonuclease [Dehalococcoidia bacterium]
MTTRSSLKQPNTVDYTKLEPLPDPPREPDMQQHEHLLYAGSSLRAHFADRDDILISGEGYLRHEATNDAERLAPDCVVTFGVEPKAIVARNGYVISEVGKPPDFVLEVASHSTGRRDYTVKRDGYAGYGVREYWRFDHTGGRFYDAALAGDALVDGSYEPLEIIDEPDGLIWGHSEVLGLDLCWCDGELRFRDPSTGEFLLTPEEGRVALETAEARVAELEAELRELRGQ